MACDLRFALPQSRVLFVSEGRGQSCDRHGWVLPVNSVSTHLPGGGVRRADGTTQTPEENGLALRQEGIRPRDSVRPSILAALALARLARRLPALCMLLGGARPTAAIGGETHDRRRQTAARR